MPSSGREAGFDAVRLALLLRKETGRQTDWDSLLQALASHIDKPDEQARFLKAAAKAGRS